MGTQIHVQLYGLDFLSFRMPGLMMWKKGMEKKNVLTFSSAIYKTDFKLCGGGRENGDNFRIKKSKK